MLGLTPEQQQMYMMMLGGRLLANSQVSNRSPSPIPGLGQAVLGSMGDLAQIRHTAQQSKQAELDMQRTQMMLDEAARKRDQEIQQQQMDAQNRADSISLYDKYIAGRDWKPEANPLSAMTPMTQVPGDAYMPAAGMNRVDPNPDAFRQGIGQLAMRQAAQSGDLAGLSRMMTPPKPGEQWTTTTDKTGNMFQTNSATGEMKHIWSPPKQDAPADPRARMSEKMSLTLDFVSKKMTPDQEKAFSIAYPMEYMMAKQGMSGQPITPPDLQDQEQSGIWNWLKSLFGQDKPKTIDYNSLR